MSSIIIKVSYHLLQKISRINKKYTHYNCIKKLKLIDKLTKEIFYIYPIMFINTNFKVFYCLNKIERKILRIRKLCTIFYLFIDIHID